MIVSAGTILTRSAFLASSLLFSSPALLRHEQLNLETYSECLPQPNPPFSSSELISDSNNPALSNSQFEDDFYRSRTARIRALASSMLDKDPSLAGRWIRLAFHDATTYEKSNPSLATGGSNASIRYELNWSENRALSKPLAEAETIWTDANSNNGCSSIVKCDKVISLADVIALLGAVAVEHAGGPKIQIRMGRKDSPTSDPRTLRQPMQRMTERSKVESTMPSAGLDSDGLRLYFGKRLGIKEEEFVALSGVHGLGRHVTLLGMPKSCLKNLTRDCLENAPQNVPFVTSSVDHFSNAYFQALLLWYNRRVKLGDVAFIPTDVNLVVDSGLRKHVQRFATNEASFHRVFIRAYQKLVESTAVTSLRY